MESGLEDRNNSAVIPMSVHTITVSMESGLEDRNNPSQLTVFLARRQRSQWSPA